MENGAREDGRGWSPAVLSMSLFRPASTWFRAGFRSRALLRVWAWPGAAKVRLGIEVQRVRVSFVKAHCLHVDIQQERSGGIWRTVRGKTAGAGALWFFNEGLVRPATRPPGGFPGRALLRSPRIWLRGFPCLKSEIPFGCARGRLSTSLGTGSGHPALKSAERTGCLTPIPALRLGLPSYARYAGLIQTLRLIPQACAWGYPLAPATRASVRLRALEPRACAFPPGLMPGATRLAPATRA